jgi:myo-inositol-1(or 4)-monophosphatase
LDAYIDIRGKIRVTDVAAAYLVVKEAGGKLFAPNGSELDSSLTGNERVSFLAVSSDSLFSDLASIITNP